jgi:hypothetical protein
MTDNELALMMMKVAGELALRARTATTKKPKKGKAAKAVKAAKATGGKTWVLGKTRGRVPQFVLDTTKAKNKQELVLCYAQGSKFVEGEPLPKQLA